MTGWITFLVIFGMGGGFIIGSMAGAEATMQQAFERGYAVQCIGKTGYHWECGE